VSVSIATNAVLSALAAVALFGECSLGAFVVALIMVVGGVIGMGFWKGC